MLMRYTTMRIVQLIPLILVVTIVVFFVMMIVPGADDIQLYQPSHKLAYDL